MNLRANSEPMRCAVPAMDPIQRAMMPVALFGLYGFMLLWIGLLVSFSFNATQLFARGTVVDATVHLDPQGGAASAHYVDAAGVKQSLELSRKRDYSEGEPVELLNWADQTDIRSDVHSDLLISALMLLGACVPFFAARTARRALASDKARMTRLRSGIRRTAIALRVEREKPQRSRNKASQSEFYRVWARFEHPNGVCYEAPSELSPMDPGELKPEQVFVWADPADPRLSLIDESSLPGWRERLARARKP